MGKIDAETCECGGEAHTVEHVLLRCDLASDARIEGSGWVEETLEAMLYTDKRIAWTMTVWDEFCEQRRKIRRKEDEKEKHRELEWG